MNHNVTIIGMPGSGKSTVGVVLAKNIGYGFVDGDLLIQEQEQRLLREIIEQDGLDGFLAIENRVHSQLAVDHCVIAPGGSVVYEEEAMRHLREIGVVVYLKLSYKTVAYRLGDLRQRGVALKEGQTLMDLYEERCPLYEKFAHFTVEGDDMTISEVMLKMRSVLLQNKVIEILKPQDKEG